MNKQLVVTTKDTKETVCKELERAGFKRGKIDSEDWRFITIYPDLSFADNNHTCGVRPGYILPDSYVLAHADELDGAKKPWEIPPEGYRLVTDEERKLHQHPMGETLQCRYKTHTSKELWYDSFDAEGWDQSDVVFAVRPSYSFEPETIEVTMADLEEKYGRKVKVVK